MCILCGSPIQFAVSRGELRSPAIAFDFLQFNGNTQIVGVADSATRRSLMKPPRNDTEVVPYTRRGGVRVSGGDLCIRKYAEAPTEPVGETFHARPSTDGFLHKRNGERARRGASRSARRTVILSEAKDLRQNESLQKEILRLTAQNDKALQTRRGGCSLHPVKSDETPRNNTEVVPYTRRGELCSPADGRILHSPNGGRGSPPLRGNQIHAVLCGILRRGQASALPSP